MEIKKVLVDGDILINKAAFAAESRWYEVDGTKFQYKREAEKHVKDNGGVIEKHKDVLPVWIAKQMVDQMLASITDSTGCSNTHVIVAPPSGTTIFRHDAYPQYKANRKDLERPEHASALRSYLIDRHNAEIANDMEADDLLGIIQCAEKGTIIASIDKDLLMIPGLHYNMDSKKIAFSSDPGELTLRVKSNKSLDLKGTGFKWFAAQMLLGDTVDNIPKPAKGMGPRKVHELLKDVNDIDSMWKVVQQVYGKSDLDLDTNATLLWILRHGSKSWKHIL